MSQLSLFPEEDQLEVSQPLRMPIEGACGNSQSVELSQRAELPDPKDQVKSEDDHPSSEEKMLEVLAEEGLTFGAIASTDRRGRTFRPQAPFSPAGAWPAGLTWDAALAYTSLSPSQFRHWQRKGGLAFRRVGRNGAKVVMRAELDRLLAHIFTPIAADITEDFDFG